MEIRRRPPNPTVRVENLEYAVPHREAKAKNILEEIVWHKDIEIKNFKKTTSLEDLIKKLDRLSPPKDFSNSILQSKIKPGVIAEIKKASPSKGVIREDFKPEEIASCYERSGASCISVLTDKRFFQGSYEILQDVRRSTNLPLLCKDFIISAYQIYKARVSGADAILLIAAILSDDDLIYLKKIADNLKMSVLVEVHDDDELERILSLKTFNLIGINNRDLKTFRTELKSSIKIMSKYSEIFSKHNIIPISESGIKNSEDLKALDLIGIKGVLIGERFMLSLIHI